MPLSIGWRRPDVLRPLTTRQRNQIWGASLVLDELEDLGARIARAARRTEGRSGLVVRAHRSAAPDRCARPVHGDDALD